MLLLLLHQLPSKDDNAIIDYRILPIRKSRYYTVINIDLDYRANRKGLHFCVNKKRTIRKISAQNEKNSTPISSLTKIRHDTEP